MYPKWTGRSKWNSLLGSFDDMTSRNFHVCIQPVFFSHHFLIARLFSKIILYECFFYKNKLYNKHKALLNKASLWRKKEQILIFFPSKTSEIINILSFTFNVWKAKDVRIDVLIKKYASVNRTPNIAKLGCSCYIMPSSSIIMSSDFYLKRECLQFSFHSSILTYVHF